MINLSVHHHHYYQYEVFHPRTQTHSCIDCGMEANSLRMSPCGISWLAWNTCWVSSWRFLTRDSNDLIHLSISSQTCSIVTSGYRASQSMIRTFSKAFLAWTAISCWNIPFGALVMKGMTTGLPFLPHTDEHSVSLQKIPYPSCFISNSYPHHDSRVGVVCVSIIATSCNPSPGHLRTCWRRSGCHKQKRDSLLNTHRMPLNVPVDFGSTPWKSLFVVCYQR